MIHHVKTIAFAGSGNVAWHLAKGLLLQGYQISHIWSRDEEHARALAVHCNAKTCKELSALGAAADLIIIAAPDHSIESVAQNIGTYNGIVVHTAGSVPMEILKGLFSNYGIIYPLQTFSKDIPLALRDVPFFLESSSPDVMEAIEQVTLTLSPNVHKADSYQRQLLHVAAVFAGNYSNLMYIIGNELLSTSNLPGSILHPLIEETARKAVHADPLIMQTGPARRNDSATMHKHIEALASHPEYAELYKLLAKLISKKYQQ
jgi:predicted short-subunit dehydrogenase-like oxidoreductase (DUF2520 family)